MDPLMTALAAGVLGMVVGIGALAAFRLSERAQHVAVVPDDADLAPGVGDVLAVLRSSAVVLDAADGVVKASAAAYAFGLVRGHHLVHPELRRLAREVRRDGVIREAELELRRGPLGRSSMVAQARVAPLGAHHILLLMEDRTEARRVDEVRRDFVANISHELKTPVGALSLLAEAVAEAADDPEAVRHFASRMGRESQRLGRLVQEIIDLSRLQVADALHDPEPVPVDDVVAEAVDRNRLAAEAKDISVVVGGVRGCTVYGARDLLVTAVSNLVDNAINYSEAGTRVGVGVRRAQGLVEIDVTDQGIGIPETDLGRVFERFYRVDPARSRLTGGTGLGLSIVKHVASNHGGEVTVWSREGAGSTFTVRLPETSAGRPDADPPAGAPGPQAVVPRAPHTPNTHA